MAGDTTQRARRRSVLLALCLLLLLEGIAHAASRSKKKCRPPKKNEVVLLVVAAVDPELAQYEPAVTAAMRKATSERLLLLPKAATKKAVTAEGGQEKRENIVVEGRLLVRRARERFSELEAEDALELIAKATALLSQVHQEPAALDVLADAHLLAAAIFFALERTEAGRNRLQRALDLKPNLTPPRHRFPPRVFAELAAVRATQNDRPVGRLEVRLGDEKITADVYLDGRRLGQTPLSRNTVGVGRHLIRVKAPGYRSFIDSVQIRSSRGTRVRANLIKDKEAGAIKRLSSQLRAGQDVTDVLHLLTDRSGADRALLAAIVVGDRLTFAGTATIGLHLTMPGAGSSFTRSLVPSALQSALMDVLSCEKGGAPALAPPILGSYSGILTKQPVPEPDAFWERPWFWTVAAIAALSVSSVVVGIRASGGPPEAVRITVEPRPIDD